MDLHTDGRALMLVRQLLDPTKTKQPKIKTTVQKPTFAPQPLLQPFPRSTPEAEGVDSARIAAFITDLRSDNTLDPHGMMLLRHGKVIAQTAFGAYDQSVWHITHSECKSITGLAIGMLIDEGKLQLEDSIVALLPEKTNRLTALTHRAITLRHLLTMTSGIAFNEAGSVTETDWARCYFESAVLTEPGKVFNYNSMNTYMLSAIVKAVSGQSLTDYLTPRLFQPLGIENFFWEKCPLGTEKGGWGLYILPEDMAKIGQMVLDRGLWKGRRIVSAEWIDAATSKQAEAPANLGDYNYGYQIWVGREEHTFLFNGMFGQNVLGYFDSGLLLTSNAGNNELFQQSSYYPLTSKYFGAASFPEGPLPADPAGEEALENACRYARQDLHVTLPSLFGDALTPVKADVPALIQRLDGKSYYARDERAASVGIYPLYAQALQNNYPKGLRAVSFREKNGALLLVISEKDEDHEAPVGFGAPAYATVNTHGEIHRVGVSGRFSADGDGFPLLKVRISFQETANSRIILFQFRDDRLIVRWSESPGKAYLTEALASLKEQVALIGSMMSKSDQAMLNFRITRMVEPEVVMFPRK